MTKFGHAALAALAAAAMVPASAEAALNLTLSFAEPTGTTTTTATIPIYLTATLAPGSDSGVGYLDNTAALIAEYGSQLTSEGIDLVGHVVTFGFTGYLDCGSGAFGVCTSGGSYLSLGASTGNPFGTLSAGDTGTILFGTLSPRGGVAPEGDYTLTRVTYELTAMGFDTDSNFIEVSLGQWSTPFGGTPFTRTVEADAVPPVAGAVPEPATWAMMIAGFGLVGAGLRRRKPAMRFA